MHPHRFLIPLAALVALGATACSPSGSAERTIRVELRDGAVVVDIAPADRAKLGELFQISDDSHGFVTFAVTNTGTEPHQFVVVETDSPSSALPMAGDRVRLASRPGAPAVGVLYTEFMQTQWGHADEGTIAPGETLAAIVEPPREPAPRRLVLLCNLPGHYHRGEHAELSVGS